MAPNQNVCFEPLLDIVKWLAYSIHIMILISCGCNGYRTSQRKSLICYYLTENECYKLDVTLQCVIQSPNQISLWSSMLFSNLNPNTLTLVYACLVGMSIDLNNAEDKPNVLHCNYMLQLTKSKLFCILHTASHHQAATQMLLFQLQSHPEINKIYLKFTSTIKKCKFN